MHEWRACKGRAGHTLMQAQNRISGLPRRMGVALSAWMGEESSAQKLGVIWKLQNDVESIALDLTGEQLKAAILTAAERAARQCYNYVERFKFTGMIVEGIALLCHQMRVSQPRGETSQEIIARAVNQSWWARQIRVEHKRRFEHNAIQLGFTSKLRDPYISRESALRQAQYNLENQKLLESVTLTNGRDEFTVAELASKGTANKAIRRGELMTRIRGFEEIANACGHVGQFWTITCPSEFHSVGGTNKNYNGATPRQAQAYLVHVWAVIRSALHRQGLRVYGFRIAEPHTDGCPHWHMLFFVGPTVQPKTWHPPMVTAHIQRTPVEAARRVGRIVTLYARAWHPHEKGAKENRIKLVRIEAGKGTAAGYIAKYVSKNIDGAGVGDHKTFENGETYTIVPDMFGNEEITPSQRVTYWSQVWGIRQFQQIGGAPIGVWRELRRIKAETVAQASAEIKTAWQAVQSIKGGAEIAKQADFAAYVMAQGGPLVGRGALIKIEARDAEVDGRYGRYEAKKPVGVYAVSRPNQVYESVRYTWTVKPGGAGVGVAFDLPWTGVNNCTEPGTNAAWVKPEPAPESLKNQKICSANVGGWWEQDKTRLKPDQSQIKTFQMHRKAGPPMHLDYLIQKHAE